MHISTEEAIWKLEILTLAGSWDQHQGASFSNTVVLDGHYNDVALL